MEKPIKFAHMIAAHPGFSVLEVPSEESASPDSVNANPVVAWALEAGSYAPYPITLEGVQIDNVAILRPDGKVEYPCSGLFLDTAEWLDWKRCEREQKNCGAA